MIIVSLFIDAPDQLASTRLVRTREAACGVLRELYPELTAQVANEDLVHHLRQQAIAARIEEHDITSMLTTSGVASSSWGDLYRIDTLLSVADARRGQFLRPATAFEAALSRSCARMDGGVGVFGVRARDSHGAGGRVGRFVRANTSEGTGADSGLEYLHYGTPAWEQALLGPVVRYFRVQDVPTGTILPAVPDDLLT